MSAISIGYSSIRPTDDVVAVSGTDFSKIGLCTTSEDANVAIFPLNKVVRFNSKDPIFLAGAGTGHLKAALTGINDQLGSMSADMFVVRVAEGTGADAAAKLAGTFANIIGDAGAGTGFWALRNAPSSAKGAPKLWGAPGYTYQQPDGEGVDNAVRAALDVHTAATKSIAIVDVDATSMVKAIAARELMSSDRLMPLGVAARVYETIDGVSTLVTRPMSPRILGLIVAADNNYRKGMPFDSFCNKRVLGLADINRPITYDMGDGASEAQLMLTADVAVVVAGESANPGAIADGGFTFLGVESAATSDLWSQIHQVRAADYIDAEIAKLARLYIGGRITPRRAESFFNAVRFALNDHVTDEDILGFELLFPKAINSINDVGLGNFSIRTNAEPAPVLRRVHNEMRRYRPGLAALIDAISAAANGASATV